MKELTSQILDTLECWGIPRASIDHLLQAEKETLLAVRALVDCGVDCIEDLLKRGEKGSGARPEKRGD